ncbi:AimR family lysis-lysogeny pheromone receptor [Oceanobacillus sp. CF4.6]|uniref:AimR family lysis-lysogeny pheromone receptor n=1 Tax=Oceanobacillus sp. CF4.6 TaxID=3373080 RepID=UPI003EE7CD6A
MLEKLMTSQSEFTITEMMNLLSEENNSDSVKEMMKKTCLQSSSKNIQKKGMEYLYMNGFTNELEVLIEKNLESDNPSNRLWGLLYQIMVDQQLWKDNPHETLQRLQNYTTQYSTNEPELLFLMEVIKEDAYQRLAQYDRVGNLMVTYQQYFSNIEERIIVSYFKIRVYRINIIYHLMRNELIMARKYAYRSLNMIDSKSIHACIHTHLGLSYTFDTYEKGMYHLNKALEISKEQNNTRLIHILENKNIPFLSSHFNEVDNVTTTDIGEQAHMELAKGNKSKAIELLENLPQKTAFQLYYLGKAKEDRGLLLQSYTSFIEKRSDYFFSRLPINAIREL